MKTYCPRCGARMEELTGGNVCPNCQYSYPTFKEYIIASSSKQEHSGNLLAEVKRLQAENERLQKAFNQMVDACIDKTYDVPYGIGKEAREEALRLRGLKGEEP